MLQKNVFPIQIAEGLDTNTDDKLVASGKSIALENARFHKIGRLSKRFGNSALPVTTSDGDLDDKEIKAIVSDNNLLSVVTDEGVFNFNDGRQVWDKVSTLNESVKISTEFISKSELNHFRPDADYHSGLNMMVTVFREANEAELLQLVPSKLTIILEDCTTGSRKIKRIPTGILSYELASQKVMLVEYLGEPRILLFGAEGTTMQLTAWILDKDLEYVVAPALLESHVYPQSVRWKIDVCKDDEFIYLAYAVNTSLVLRRYDFGGVLQSTVAHVLANRLGSEIINESGLGLSVCLSEEILHLLYCSNAVGSYGATKLVAIGFSKDLAITKAATTKSLSLFPGYFHDVSIVYDDIQNLVSVACSIVDHNPSPKTAQLNYYKLDFSAAYVFTELSPYIRRVSLICRPFIFNGSTYVIAKCVETEQPTGFVVNLDSALVVSGISPYSLSPSRTITGAQDSGTCNTVFYNDKMYSAAEKAYTQNTNGVSDYGFSPWMAIAKLMLDFNDTPDSGTIAKVGETLYYTNGLTIALDGRSAYESGFFFTPKIQSIALQNDGAGPISSKTFTYVAVYEFFNGKGELERSIPSPELSVTTAASTTYIKVLVKKPEGSSKLSIDLSGENRFSPIITIYRTTHNGTVFYKVSSEAISAIAENITVYDAAPDSEIQDNQILYTNGGVIESDSTPNAKFSTSGGNRHFLGGLEDDDEIAYSIKQLYGEAVSHSDFFRIRISSATNADKTKMSGLAYLDGKLIIGRKNSLYFIAGDGPLLTGRDNTFTEPEIISSDTGINDPRSVVNIPQGVMFKSKKGIYLLDRALSVSYVGAPVDDYNSERIVAAIVSDIYNEARFYTDAGNILVFNYIENKWSVYKNQTTTWANIWNGKSVQVMNGKVVQEDESLFKDDGTYYGLLHSTSWLKMNLVQGVQRIWRILLIGNYKSAHTLVLRAYYDYDDTVYDEYEYEHDPASPTFQWRVHLKKQVCQAIRLVIFDKDQSGTGESFSLTNIQAEVGIKPGSAKLGKTKTN